MSKIFKIFIAITIAIVIIIIARPYVRDYKEHKQYAFKVNTIDGEITKDSFKGKYLAIYFGYTFCPDVCPTSLSSLAQAINRLPKEKAKDFVGLFISVDPDRDTLKNLKEYAHYFHPNFIGATSTKKNIDDITSRYKTYYKKINLKDSAMGYSVSHTSFIYIFDKDGKFRAKVDHFSDPAKIKETLEEIVK
ncbi:SCO family protein [Arcobacter sp. F2176]|uniref:SCO family protein n=1 Tax=unclassified Arcobacter TaxID=2593671 RepID=UPI00100BC2DD|nr:SCO family protein [Arcobacter sp. F2176]RXJ81816.1 hypothetical protein CRU95_05605 [Arcobacter sp. F2176]